MKTKHIQLRQTLLPPCAAPCRRSRYRTSETFTVSELAYAISSTARRFGQRRTQGAAIRESWPTRFAHSSQARHRPASPDNDNFPPRDHVIEEVGQTLPGFAHADLFHVAAISCVHNDVYIKEQWNTSTRLSSRFLKSSRSGRPLPQTVAPTKPRYWLRGSGDIRRDHIRATVTAVTIASIPSVKHKIEDAFAASVEAEGILSVSPMFRAGNSVSRR